MKASRHFLTSTSSGLRRISGCCLLLILCGYVFSVGGCDHCRGALPGSERLQQTSGKKKEKCADKIIKTRLRINSVYTIIIYYQSGLNID